MAATEVSQALADHAEGLLADAAGRGQRAIDRVETDLVTFARLLVHQVRLRKALADPGLPPELKQAVLADLGQGRMDQASVELLATAAAHQRVPLRHFPDLLAGLAAMAAFAAAERAGELERLESELFFVATLIERQPELRSALTNPGLPVANKQALLDDLLADRVGRRTTALVDLLVELHEGHELDTRLKEWAGAAAARRNRVVAEVRSAVELDDARRDRLAEVLTRVLGKPVVLQVSIDPAILGSVVVRVGDDLFDGSIRSRLEQAREALGVA